MALPRLTPEERQANLDKAAASRRERAEVKNRLIAEARAALSGPFRRGYDSFFAALDAIEPKATGNGGAWRLPRGDQYYANQLRFFTTTDLGADEIHRMLEDSVVEGPEDIDLCLILGAGWPFQMGGVTPYLDREGASQRAFGGTFHDPQIRGIRD